MFERHHEPLLPLPRFLGRMAKSLAVAAIISGVGLTVGAVGLRRLEGLDWMDAWLNAVLVMTGNGPIAPAQSVSGKTFLLFYALGGVLVFAAVIATVMAPILHRILHTFHVDVPDEESPKSETRTSKQIRMRQNPKRET
jgi:hypothetical protein